MGRGYGGGAVQCIVWLWLWFWFWGICIPNCYGSGTARARGAYARRGYGDGISAGFSGIRESSPATLENRHIFVLCAGAKMRFMPTGLREMHFRAIFGWTSAPLYVGRVISGDAKMQRYRQSRQCPTRRGRHFTAAPSTMGNNQTNQPKRTKPWQKSNR